MGLTPENFKHFRYAVPSLYRILLNIAKLIDRFQSKAFLFKYAEEGIDPSEIQEADQEFDIVFYDKRSINRGLLRIDQNNRAIYLEANRERINEGNNPSYSITVNVYMSTGGGETQGTDKKLGKYDLSCVDLETIECLFQTLTKDDLKKALLADWPANVVKERRSNYWPDVSMTRNSFADPDEPQGTLASRAGAGARVQLGFNLVSCVDYDKFDP